MASPPKAGQSILKKRDNPYDGHHVPLKKRQKLMREAAQLLDNTDSNEHAKPSSRADVGAKPSFGAGDVPRPSFCGDGLDRPSFGGNDETTVRPSFGGGIGMGLSFHGDGLEIPSFRGNDVMRPSFGGDDLNRPSFSSSDETRPLLGGSSLGKSFDGRSDTDVGLLPTIPPPCPTQSPLTKNGTKTPQVAADFLIKPGAEPVYSDFAAKMMAKMGHKKGEGLGKHGQGRVNIVEASMQRGRRGLGLTIKAFEPSDVNWDHSKEEVTANEVINWMEPCTEEIPTIETLRTWIVEGPRQHTLQDDYEFCNEKLVNDVCNCKSVFDNLEPEEMRRARTKSNPYESIRGVFFLNRAAMKMANMDAVTGFMFTDPRRPDGKPVDDEELLYFADVCAGPGGFSEYVLWKKRCEAKGFGFTLKGSNDFKLEDFFAAPSECFEPHYGVGGLDGDGDVYKPENLRAFQKFVMENTGDKGVHFVMADGGFDVSGNEGDQEWLSKRLYLCECIAALSILRTGGHFVCKLFDVFLVYSVGLIHLMHLAFDQIAIFKPVTSRPANSERYIICKGLRPGAHVIHEFLFEANLRFNELGTTSSTDINEIVPVSVLSTKQQFVEYIVTSNEALGLKQAIALSKIKAFAQNPQLYENRQAQMRTDCLCAWQIPERARTAPDKSTKPLDKFTALMQNKDMELFSCQPEILSTANLESQIKSVYNYRCYLAADHRWLLLGLGKSYVFRWDGKPNTRWQKVEFKMELPPDTLIEAEFVKELRGEGKGQRRVTAVHVLDAIMLGGTDVQELHFNKRMEKLTKFVKAITRKTRGDLVQIRVKEMHRLEEMADVFTRLTMRVVKGSGGLRRLCYCPQIAKEEYIPIGVYLVKIVKGGASYLLFSSYQLSIRGKVTSLEHGSSFNCTEEPWTVAFSHSQNRKYFFNSATGASTFETPKEVIAPYRYCYKHLLLWQWESGLQMQDSQSTSYSTKLSKEYMLNFIKTHTHR